MRRCGLALAVSALLLAPAARAADPPAAPALPAYQSPGMRIAGIVLTSVAAAGIAAGAVTIALTARAGSEDVRLSGINYGGLGIGAGVLFGVTGVPLWVVGSRPPGPPSASLRRPEIAIGPAACSLRWTF